MINTRPMTSPYQPMTSPLLRNKDILTELTDQLTSPSAAGIWLQDQLDRLPAYGGTIEIPPGTYEGQFVIDKPNVTLKTKGQGEVKLTSSTPRSGGDYGNYGSTLWVKGNNFKASGLTIENTAPLGSYAVKLNRGGMLENCTVRSLCAPLFCEGNTLFKGGELQSVSNHVYDATGANTAIIDTKINCMQNPDTAILSNPIVHPYGNVIFKNCPISGWPPDYCGEGSEKENYFLADSRSKGTAAFISCPTEPSNLRFHPTCATDRFYAGPPRLSELIEDIRDPLAMD